MRETTISVRRQSLRRGVTAVETAIMLPLVFLLFFALFEFSRVNMIRHSIECAAFEGARSAVVPGATADDARTAALTILGAVKAKNTKITVTPAVITDETPTVTVTIDVPLDDNAWIVPKFFRGATLTSSATLARERSDESVY